MKLTANQKSILELILNSAKNHKKKGDYRTYERYKSDLHSNGIFGYERELADALKL